jgi:hypothetical protein
MALSALYHVSSQGTGRLALTPYPALLLTQTPAPSRRPATNVATTRLGTRSPGTS